MREVLKQELVVEGLLLEDAAVTQPCGPFLQQSQAVSCDVEICQHQLLEVGKSHFCQSLYSFIADSVIPQVDLLEALSFNLA